MKHEHQWGEWVGYDPIVIEFGISDGFHYHRECMVLGCKSKQRVEGLEPVGKSEIVNEEK